MAELHAALAERIAAFVRDQAYRPLSATELAQALALSAAEEKALPGVLADMEASGTLVRNRTGRYGAPERMNLAVGRIQAHAKGFAFLLPDHQGMADVFIGRENLSGAMHNDRVVVRLVPSLHRGNRLEGEVIRILKRANQRVVGTYQGVKWAGFVTPDDHRLRQDIFVPKGADGGARPGEKVVVELMSWPDDRRGPEGKVVERLGMADQPGVDIVSVLRKFGLPEAFPPRVLEEAARISDAISPAERARRRDLCDLPTVTIDGEDAKDLDDAVSLQRRDGRWHLGVHIADVAHYVAEGSALDKEARERATSVYPADRVVPMLPPRLSNDICSLNPQVERLTLSVLMEIDDKGRVVKHTLARSVIKTRARLTYTLVGQILDGDKAARAEQRALVSMLEEMQQVMELLRRRRLARGSLDFDLAESKVVLDAAGRPVDVHRAQRHAAHMIIEEFMLVANQTVAEHFYRLDVPFLYRIHAEPAADKLQALAQFLGLFGYNLKLPKGSAVLPPLALQKVLTWAAGRKEEGLINTVLLRSLQQARYSHECSGHFGLAAPYYTHFTSPIRRYPDLVIHRVVHAMLDRGGLHPRRRARWEREFAEIAVHASERERLAVEAERETLDLKKAEYMQDKVGEVYEGLISGVTAFGFFVQLANTVEGLVHVSTLNDDYYHYHEDLHGLVGERTRKMYRLGDAITVRVAQVDVGERRVDFAVADDSKVSSLSSRGSTRGRGKKEVSVGSETGRRRRSRGRRRQPAG